MLVAAAGMGNGGQHELEVYPVESWHDVSQDNGDVFSQGGGHHQEPPLPAGESPGFFRKSREVDPGAHLVWPFRGVAGVHSRVPGLCEAPTEAP